MVNYVGCVLSHLCHRRCVVSRMGDWVLEMQEDCIYMDRGPWAEKHGHNYLYIYDEYLGIVPDKFSDEPRSCDETTRTSEDYGSIPV